MGDDDASLTGEISKHKAALEARNESLLAELQSYWREWDCFLEKNPGNDSGVERQKIRDKMVDVLNRRNYIRNLVRDVNAALES